MTGELIRVLIVDDHAVVREGIRLMLSGAEDIEVSEAETAQQALAAAREREFDVALVDIGLPDKNGLELLRLLKSERPKLAVLMLSMYAEKIYAVRALKHGAAGYLTKNSRPSAILAAVRRVAAGGMHVNPDLVDDLASELRGTRREPHEQLSDRELEVLRLLASGKSLVEIAHALHLSPKTVTTYRARILDKTGLRSNAELARYALENGLLA